MTENVSNTKTISIETYPATTLNQSTSPSNIAESNKTSIVDSGNNDTDINSDDKTAIVTAVATGDGVASNGTNFVSPSTIADGSSTTSVGIPLSYENGSNQLSIENIKYLVLVVFGLLMVM